MTSKTYSLW